ncbi:hypothetical protein ACFLVE_04320 [Chloroflexota bacterium]
MSNEPSGKRKLAIPLFGIVFALFSAFPGALTGAITGFLGIHLVTAIVGGILFFILYPWQRRKQGYVVDGLTYFNAICGAVGGSLACFFVGQAVHGL